jgi:hypothetical protein
LFGTTSDPSPPPLMFWWQIPQQAYNNTISDASPSASILLHTDKSWHQNCAHLPFGATYHSWFPSTWACLSNPWCKHQYHFCRTFIQQHSQTQTEEITDLLLWIPTCYWMRYLLFYSFYYSRTRWSLMSRHMTQSWWLVLVVVKCFRAFSLVYTYSHIT